MGPQKLQLSSKAWALAESQHGVVTRRQLLELGFGPDGIKHRVTRRRLHPVRLGGKHALQGVYAVGRPQLTQHGHWMAAVLSCGPEAMLSHDSAAALWGIRAHRPGPIHVWVPARVRRRRPGIVVHRRATIGAGDKTVRDAIPVTTPIRTLIDLATCLNREQLEAAINEADKRALVDPETLRAAIAERAHLPGLPLLRKTLDRRTFTLTDSDLERYFLPIARNAKLPLPLTQEHVNGFRVDFYWPDIGLVVETDGLRYHRTPAQQARDRLRDQAHVAAGLTAVRFTHAQVRYDPRYVQATLVAVARRLRAAQPQT